MRGFDVHSNEIYCPSPHRLRSHVGFGTHQSNPTLAYKYYAQACELGYPAGCFAAASMQIEAALTPDEVSASRRVDPHGHPPNAAAVVQRFTPQNVSAVCTSAISLTSLFSSFWPIGPRPLGPIGPLGLTINFHNFSILSYYVSIFSCASS